MTEILSNQQGLQPTGGWQNKSGAKQTFPSDLNSEECNSDDFSLEILEEDSPSVEWKIPLAENEEELINKFFEEIKDVTEENEREYKAIVNNLKKRLIKGECTEEKWTKSAVEKIKKVTDKYLEKGIRLNSCCNGCEKTVTNLIFEEIIGILDSTTNTTSGGEALGFGTMGYCGDEAANSENVDIIRGIVSSLLLRGGKVKQCFFDYDRMAHSTAAFIDDNFRKQFDKYFLKQSKEEESEPEQLHEYFSERCKQTKGKLKKLAGKSIINKCDEEKDNMIKAIEYGYNGYFCVEYSQDSIIEAAKVINDSEVRSLDFRFHIFQIGESMIKVENIEEKRNYTDVLKGSIEISFATEAGKISVCLSPSNDGSNEIKVEVSDNDRKKLDQLKGKEEIGKNCLLGGLPVSKAIEQGSFARSGKSMCSEVIGQSDRKQEDSWVMREKLRRISGTEREKVTTR